MRKQRMGHWTLPGGALRYSTVYSGVLIRTNYLEFLVCFCFLLQIGIPDTVAD